MLFCFSICSSAVLISASVAVTLWRRASCNCNFSSINERKTCEASRWRISSVSGRLDEIITIRTREARSNTEMTWSLTTAAMRISGEVLPGCGEGAGWRVAAAVVCCRRVWASLAAEAATSAAVSKSINE